MRLLASLLLVLASSQVAAQTQSHEKDRAQIDKLYADYRVAVENADIAGYVGALHPEVRLLPPGAAAIVGAQNYAGFLEPVFETADYRIDVVSMPAIEIMGDTAIAEYTYIIHLKLKNPEVGVTEPGALTESRTQSRYFDVLRKREDGQWAIWRHTWSVLPE
ncbi:MAG: nuclear transport factor 2 family protein [Halieaceae bacterium]|nr:nuclear transport factor 2 family protein [Halieaceae bacterium]